MIPVSVIGIDPGRNGAISYISPDRSLIKAIKMPENEDDILAELLILFELGESVVYLEKAQSMAFKMEGMAFSGMSKYLAHYGFLRGCLKAIGFNIVDIRPSDWQKALSCRTKGDKNVTKNKAIELFPHMKITHANADALLLAEYGYRDLLIELGQY